MNEGRIIDYCKAFPEHLAAQGRGDAFLALSRLDKPFQRNRHALTQEAAEYAHYELNFRWLTGQCQDEDDRAWESVIEEIYSYWREEEITPLLEALAQGQSVNLFDSFLVIEPHR